MPCPLLHSFYSRYLPWSFLFDSCVNPMWATKPDNQWQPLMVCIYISYAPTCIQHSADVFWTVQSEIQGSTCKHQIQPEPLPIALGWVWTNNYSIVNLSISCLGFPQQWANAILPWTFQIVCKYNVSSSLQVVNKTQEWSPWGMFWMAFYSENYWGSVQIWLTANLAPEEPATPLDNRSS